MSLEIVKVAQIVFLNNDIDMYHEETNTPLEARTSTINEDLGQIRFVSLSIYLSNFFDNLVASFSPTKQGP